jgi:hypothetical protein
LDAYYAKLETEEAKLGFVRYMAEAFKRYAIVQRDAERMQEQALEKLRRKNEIK